MIEQILTCTTVMVYCSVLLMAAVIRVFTHHRKGVRTRGYECICSYEIAMITLANDSSIVFKSESGYIYISATDVQRTFLSIHIKIPRSEKTIHVLGKRLIWFFS